MEAKTLAENESAQKKPKVGVGVLIERDGKILMGKRVGSLGEGTWCLPGGHVEFGERLVDAAKREAKEETGLDVSKMKLVSISDDIMYGKHYVTIVFRASEMSDGPIIREEGKFEDMRWFDINNLPKPMFVATENALKNYFSKTIYVEAEKG
jgi:8-oxo-dGTP diphosphatase